MKVSPRSISLLVVMFFAVLSGCSGWQANRREVDPLGELEIRRNQTIQIGVLVPDSGDVMTIVGTDVIRGVELAIADHGRILGYLVEATPIYTQCSQTDGDSSSVALNGDQSIAALIGPICSSACDAAIPILDEARLTAVSPGCGASSLVDQALHNEAFLRTLYDDRLEGEAAARFAYLELGARLVAVIGDGTMETDDTISAFTSTFQQLGGEIVASEIIASGDSNYRTQLGAIAELEPDLIFAPLLPDDAVVLTVQKAGTPAAEIPLLGGRHYRNREFIRQVGSASDGIYAVSPYLSSEDINLLAAQYEETYQEQPATDDYLFAYDAASLILDAIAQASRTGSASSLMIGRQALRSALYETTLHEGLTGSITCSAFGDCSAASLAVYSLDGTEWELRSIP